MTFTLEVTSRVAWGRGGGLWRQKEGFLLEVGMSSEWEARRPRRASCLEPSTCVAQINTLLGTLVSPSAIHSSVEKDRWSAFYTSGIVLGAGDAKIERLPLPGGRFWSQKGNT